MEWYQFLGGIGFGVMAAKLLDIFWLQKVLEKRERRQWLRDKKLEAFSLLAKDLLSMGTTREDMSSPFEGYTIAAGTLLILEDQEIVKGIENFIKSYSDLASKRKELTKEKKFKDAFSLIRQSAHKLVNDLREDLLST